MNARSASVLVGLLWCLALLSVVVIGVLHTTSVELRVVNNHGDLIQAHYLALAGIEKAKALIYQDAMTRQRSGRNHTGELYNAPRDFKEVPYGRGVFSVFRQGRREETSGLVYGISDEESRLNLNHASQEELGKLYEMKPDIVAAIVDWRDEDSVATPGGAEAEYYASLQPPYLPRNGPFQTTRELLMVRGVSRELFAGEDANMNGLLDAEEDDGNQSLPPDNSDGVLDDGWSGLFTVDSLVRNVSASGQDRVNVQSADENTLTGVHGVSSEIAKAIVNYRGQNRLESLADLLRVVPSNPGNPPAAQPNPDSNANPEGNQNQPSPRGRPGSRPSSPSNNPVQQASGPPVISEDLLLDLADDVTTSDSREEAGLINLNTASPEVLGCLSGITPELAQAIVSYRRSSGFFPNTAWLLRVPGMNRDIFKQVAPRVTARSETFRILSEGRISSSGVRQRIQVIVHLSATDIETLSYREDL